MNIPAYTECQDNKLYQDQLSQALVSGLSDSGWTPPAQTTQEINASAPNMPNGTFWYNSQLNQIQVKTPDGIKTVPFV